MSKKTRKPKPERLLPPFEHLTTEDWSAIVEAAERNAASKVAEQDVDGPVIGG